MPFDVGGAHARIRRVHRYPSALHVFNRMFGAFFGSKISTFCTESGTKCYHRPINVILYVQEVLSISSKLVYYKKWTRIFGNTLSLPSWIRLIHQAQAFSLQKRYKMSNRYG